MKKRIVSWGVAFAVVASAAGGILLTAGSGRTEAVSPRDPSSVSEIEIDLILNKVKEGDLLALNGDTSAAKTAWTEARRRGLGLWPVHEGLGDSYSRFQMFEEALGEYQQTDRLLQGRSEEWRSPIVFKRAAVEAELGRHEQALASLLSLHHPFVLEGRFVELVSKSPRKAALLKQIREHAEKVDPRLYQTYAVAVGEPKEAAAAMARFAMLVAPWDENVNRQILESLKQYDLIDEAVSLCRAWSRARPDEIEPYRILGTLLWKAGREKESMAAWTSIVDVRPGDAEAHRALGQIFRDRGRYDDAARQFEAARKLRSEEPFWDQELVLLRIAQGDAAGATAAFRALTNRNWDSRFGDVAQPVRGQAISLLLPQLSEARKGSHPDLVRELHDVATLIGIQDLASCELRVVVTWDAALDVDLDVVEPGGSTVNHGNPVSSTGGRYAVDVLASPGYGPETYALPRIVPGTYKIGAHLHGEGRTTVRFVIFVHEGTSREKRSERTLVLERSGQQLFVSDLVLP